MKKKLSPKVLFIIAGIAAILDITKILSGFFVSLICVVSLIAGLIELKKPWTKWVIIGIAVLFIVIALIPIFSVMNQ